MWRSLPVLCVTAAVAAPAAAQLPADKSYELRTYRAAPGRLDELHTRFRASSLPLLQQHGAEVVGTWVPKPNPDNAVVALLAYPSAAARESIWARVVADPQWTAMKKRSDGRGLLVVGIDEVPLAAVAPLQNRTAAGLLELRTHATAEPVPGAIGAWVPTRPRAGTAMLSLHPRKADGTVAQRSLVSTTLLVAGQAEPAAGRVTVLAPTDYSPLK